MSQPFVRRLEAALILALLCLTLAAAPAHAESDPLNRPIPFVSNWYFNPSPPIIAAPIQLVVWGSFPTCAGRCRTTVSIRRTPRSRSHPGLRGDTTYTWSQSFMLGALAAGHHTCTLTRTFISSNGDPVDVRTWTVEFDVIDPNVPPPPPPPAWPQSWLMRGLTNYVLHPAGANAVEPTTVELFGWFAYPCGQVTGAQVLDSSHIALTLQPGPACGDTLMTWHAQFPLGLLPEGQHDLHVAMTSLGDPAESTTVTRTGSFSSTTRPTTSPPPRRRRAPIRFCRPTVRTRSIPRLRSASSSTRRAPVSSRCSTFAVVA
jgi:hypothetical protein